MQSSVLGKARLRLFLQSSVLGNNFLLAAQSTGEGGLCVHLLAVQCTGEGGPQKSLIHLFLMIPWGAMAPHRAEPRVGNHLEREHCLLTTWPELADRRTVQWWIELIGKFSNSSRDP